MELTAFIAAIKNAGGKVATEEELTEFELVLGSTLPNEIKNYLKNCSGGRIFENPVEFLDQNGVNLIPRRMYDLNAMRHAAKKPIDPWVPKELLPIGLDEGGNTIMFCLHPDRFGHIYLLDHECIYYPGCIEAPDAIETMEEAEEYRISYCSSSFNEFLKNCHPVKNI
ncbi:SMI1/KNR4 family protein [Microbulbifer sp. EKSA008]|uniref:SMI1/KNR4 family protein n=1 Tax=Microbulbifer sp. EKSA008 TaxID=3243367 RepID=UPI004042C487